MNERNVLMALVATGLRRVVPHLMPEHLLGHAYHASPLPRLRREGEPVDEYALVVQARHATEGRPLFAPLLDMLVDAEDETARLEATLARERARTGGGG